MPIILLDGPENVGKSTLAALLAQRHGYRIRKWGPVEEYHEYALPIIEDVRSGDKVVWDRGWPSEYVYGRLIPARHGRALVQNPSLGEDLFGPFVAVAAIVCGPWNYSRAVAGRDETDHMVDPERELNLYVQYGRRHGYEIVRNDWNDEQDIEIVDQLAALAAANKS